MQTVAHLSHRLFAASMQAGFRRPSRSRCQKSRSPKAPAPQLAGCPDKNLRRLHGTNPERRIYGPAALLKPYGPRSKLAAHGSLCTPPRPHCQIPDLHQNARHLHPVQLRDKRQNLSHKLIFHQFLYFFLPVAFSTGEQFGHVHFQGSCQPLQRGQGWRRLLIFDLRHVGPWYRHAQRQLPLAQTIAQPQRSNGVRQVQMPVAVAISVDWQDFWQCRRYDFRLLPIQR
jgi:hypothetical protein